MAASSSLLTQHIESFVDFSRSPTQQDASLDAVVSLLKNDIVTVGSLVKEMEMYLTTTDHIIRARGILLLGQVLASLSLKPLDNATVHSLIAFFTDRLADWRALRGALVGCLALMRRIGGGVVNSSDAKAVAHSYFKNLEVQSLGQHDRKLCFELLECLLQHYPEVVSQLSDDLFYGVCGAIDGEKDPQCLMLAFHIVEVLVKLFPDPTGPIANFAGDLFGLLSCYFPIHYTHPKAEEIDVKRDDLSRALMCAFSSTPLFEPFAVPLLLEKLSSTLPSAKVDSLKYLSYCTLKYGSDRMAKHAEVIWKLLKDAIYSSGIEPFLSSASESLDGPDSQENEIEREATVLMQKVIVQNNDLFLSLILGDEDINAVFNTIPSFKSFNEIPLQSKRKLNAVGCILYVSAKSSVTSCKEIFETFFPRLMEDTGLSHDKACCIYSNNECSKSERLNFGSLYLCTKLLEACRDIMMGTKNETLHCISENETWWHLLQCFSAHLSKTFISTFVTSTSEPAHSEADIYLGVKGLQNLATFPGGYSLISESTFDSILVAFVQVVSAGFTDKISWKLALKALVHIGSFIHEGDDTEKETKYMDTVVEKIVSLVTSDESSGPFPCRLEAISAIGTSGQKYMHKIFRKMEEVICANLFEDQGHPKSAKVTLQLLECYSSKLLQWIQKNEGFDDVLLCFVIKIWNQLESNMAFTPGANGKELLGASMKAMKLAVACCLGDSQKKIVDKAFIVLSSSTCLPHEESSSSVPIQVERLKPTKEIESFSPRDEWILSLFASVVIALRPQTKIRNLRTVLHLFVTALLKGYGVTAQAIGSVVNKLDLKSNGTDNSDDCTFEEVIDLIFGAKLWSSSDNRPFVRTGSTSNGNDISLLNFCFGARESTVPHAIVGLAWVGKGLLMRGHEKVKDVTMVFLNALLSDGQTNALTLKQGSLENNSEQGIHPSLMKCAADAFQILLTDSELCLNRKYHAIIRPLYKQRFFSTIMPILQSLLNKSESSLSRYMLNRAFAHVITETPLTVILNDAKKLIPQLLEALTLLNKDVVDKDVLYGILLVLSGILTDKKGQEAVSENARILIDCLVGLIAYPHMMLVRETGIQCLVAMSDLPHSRIYPMRVQVLQAISKALDDPKRSVRQEAVRCRQAWASIASRSLHF